MNTSKINDISKKLLIVFFWLQPVLDLVSNVFDESCFSIFGICYTTLMRFGIFAAVLFLTIIANIKKKITLVFIGYLMVYAIFVFMHQLNIRSSDFLPDNDISYNIIKCAVFVARYIMPVCIAFFVYILEFDYKSFKVAIFGAIIFVIMVVLVTNIIGKDYISYQYGSTANPFGSIFSWFSDEIGVTNWRMYTSRGLYETGNSLAAFLSLILPVTTYIAFKEKKNLLFVLVALQMVTMLLCGTKISVYGAIILVAINVGIWVFDLIFNKKRFEIKKITAIFCVAVFFGVFFFYSPFLSRIKSGEGFSTNHSEVQSEKNDSDIEIDELDEFDTFDDIENGFTDKVDVSKFDHEAKLVYVLKNYQHHYIPSVLIKEIYDYNEHTDFWFDFMTKVDFNKRNNSRKIKMLVLEDMLKNKGDALDAWVGIGETINPETDFAFLYYSYGIIGLLLFVGPFVGILLFSIISVLIQLFKRKFDDFSYILILSLGFSLVTAFYAGHVFNYYFVNVFVGLIAGMLTNAIRTRTSQ